MGQINLKASNIRFRENTNYYATTIHHGDFKVVSNSDYYSGDNEGWGWLYCNRIMSRGAGQTNYIDGNLQVSGTKNFIHPHPDDTDKVIIYTCIEAGEALTLARGVATTVNGKAIINLPEHFKLVTSSKALISVILTPENNPAVLYTTSKSKESVEVAIKEEDFFEYGDISFSFQVTGVRDQFENQIPFRILMKKRIFLILEKLIIK